MDKSSLGAAAMLSHYRVIKKLGSGGMGEVYLAQDTKLDRYVALKILPAKVAANRNRMERFVREAKSAAALNHPYIAQVFEIGEHQGAHFIAMEFIDGFTLREQIHHEATSLEKLLTYLIQAAEGLTKAHAAGIVHRDLKPDNIMITRDGFAKILDFGLAKLIEKHSSSGYDSNPSSEIVTAMMAPHSTPGMVLGTVGYMSPEQAQGKQIDHRSDIFSFGCILYEAATRKRAFEGKDAVDSLHKIIYERTPQISEVNATAPSDLQRVIRRCLAKDPEDRYQTIKDVAIELKDVRREFESLGLNVVSTARSDAPSPEVSQGQILSAATQALPAPASTRASSAEYIVSGIMKHKATTVGLIGLVAVVLGAIGVGVYKLTRQEKPVLSFQSAKFTRLTNSGKIIRVAISPDAKWLAHVTDDGGQQSLWLKQVAIANSNTQIVPPADLYYSGVAFSPDGNYVYYSVQEKNDPIGTLYQVPVLGGAARKLLTGINNPVAFAPDGKQLAFFYYYEDQDRLMIANADGTGKRQLAVRGGNEYFFRSDFAALSWSPDGKLLAAPVGNVTENQMSVVTISVETGEIRFLSPQKWYEVRQVSWLADGTRLLFTARDKVSSSFQIWQISYPAGEAKAITNDLNSYSTVSLTADFNALATLQTESVANVWVMSGLDAAHADQITEGRTSNREPAWTPDGKMVYSSNVAGGFDLYLMDASGGNPKQLTANSGANGQPSISPDGRYIVFSSDRGGAPRIWRMDIDGGNQKQLTDKSDVNPNITPDGRWVIYVSKANKDTIWKVGIDGGQAVQLTDKFSSLPAISPDGKQIVCAYIEDPSSPAKLAIFPVEGGGPIKTLPLAGQLGPNLAWSADGSAVIYVITNGGVSNLWSQPVNGGQPKQLTNFTSERIYSFDLSPDGKRLALSRGMVNSDVVMITNFR